MVVEMEMAMIGSDVMIEMTMIGVEDMMLMMMTMGANSIQKWKLLNLKVHSMLMTFWIG